MLGTFGTVGAGERGVRLRFNAVTGNVLNEGLYVKIPLVEKVKIVDVKVQKVETQSDAASKDLQTVSSIVALNYHVDPAHVAEVYQTIGTDYEARLIVPMIQESVKANTAKFTAEELITKREDVREAIRESISVRLGPQGITVDGFNIVNFDFSKSFNEAIEAKVTAEQEALRAKNQLERVKFEAEQRIAEAKGKAEAIRIEAQALQSNPQIIELRALEKWNGVLPQVTGASMPFINIK